MVSDILIGALIIVIFALIFTRSKTDKPNEEELPLPIVCKNSVTLSGYLAVDADGFMCLYNETPKRSSVQWLGHAYLGGSSKDIPIGELGIKWGTAPVKATVTITITQDEEATSVTNT